MSLSSAALKATKESAASPITDYLKEK